MRGRSGVESGELSPRLFGSAAGPTVTGPRAADRRCPPKSEFRVPMAAVHGVFDGTERVMGRFGV